MKIEAQNGDDEDDYTTEFRQYDADLGRWLSPDPLMDMYTSWSPYNFNFNNPINFTDVLGLGPDGDGVTYDESTAKGYNTGNGVDDDEGKVLPNGMSKKGGTDDGSFWESAGAIVSAVAEAAVQTAQFIQEHQNEINMAGNIAIGVDKQVQKGMDVLGQNGDKEKGKKNKKDSPKKPQKREQPQYTPAPPKYKKDGLPGFPGSKRKDPQNKAPEAWDLGDDFPKGWHGEWDGYHPGGEIEVYDKQGNHQGAWNPETGKEIPGKQRPNRRPRYDNNMESLPSMVEPVLKTIFRGFLNGLIRRMQLVPVIIVPIHNPHAPNQSPPTS